MSSENDISITKTQLKFSFKHCVVKQRHKSSRTTIQFNNYYMSSETDTSIMWGIGFFYSIFFIFLTYSDCTLLTDMPSDIVHPQKSFGFAQHCFILLLAQFHSPANIVLWQNPRRRVSAKSQSSHDHRRPNNLVSLLHCLY